MQRFCLALDLKNDPGLVSEYEAYHRAVWPEIMASIRESGIFSMEIYRTGPRLFMVMEAADDFSFERKNQLDMANPRVEAWEQLMWKYQQALPHANPGEKWVLMERIFNLEENTQKG